MCHPQWKRLEESVLKKKNLKKGISVLSALVCVLSFMELMLKKIISISACQVYVRSGLVLIKETVYFSQKSLFKCMPLNDVSRMSINFKQVAKT